MVADIGEPLLDPPDYDDETSHCKECGSPWGKHVRVGLDPDIDIECPDPERYTGRWVGNWPEA